MEKSRPDNTKLNLYFRYLQQNINKDDKRIGIHMVADAKHKKNNRIQTFNTND